MEKYIFLDHPADIKIQSFGKSLPELFLNSALGMMAFLYDVQEGPITHYETITIEAEDLESLLINFLSEILCLSDTHHRAYLTYTFKHFSENKIIIELGSIASIAQDDIKAVTYHELSIIKQEDKWIAVVVYDI